MSFKKEYIKYVEDNSKLSEQEQEVFAYLIQVFLDLWFTPKSSLEDFRKWFALRMQRYNINTLQLEYVIDNFYDYWSETNKEIKNFKTTFFNTPLLRKYLKDWYSDIKNEYLN